MTKKRILIIDDDTAIGNLEEEVLRRAGYDTVRAYSGTEAILYLRDHRPDLILLDLMLPGLSGEEVLRQISAIPVIVVSAKGGGRGQGRASDRWSGRLSHQTVCRSGACRACRSPSPGNRQGTAAGTLYP